MTDESTPILVTGATGQLGTDCVKLLGQTHQISGLGHAELDICDEKAVSAVIRDSGARIVVNAAAFTQVDRCETEAELADRVNTTGPGILAGVARQHGCRLIHISTDYVFDGNRPPPDGYREDDICRPCSRYGRSKLGGEAAILDSGADAVVIRTSWVYGLHGSNFLKAWGEMMNRPLCCLRSIMAALLTV